MEQGAAGRGVTQRGRRERQAGDEIGAGLTGSRSPEVPSPGRGNGEAAENGVALPRGGDHAITRSACRSPLTRMMWRPWRRPRTEARTWRRDDHSGDLTPTGPLRKPLLFITGLRCGWRSWRKLLIAFTNLGVETNPQQHQLAAAEFATLRLRLLKVAGRVIETASRVRLAFAAACPHAVLFRGLARSFHPAGP